MFPPLFGLSTGYQHGARQVWAVAVLQRVLAKRQLAQKQAAAAQGLTAQQWSLQLSCRDGAHVSLQRLFDLPKEVLRDLWTEYLKDHEDVIVVEDARLQRAVDANVRLADAITARTQARLNITVAGSGRISA